MRRRLTELFGDDLRPQEQIARYASQLRHLGLKSLATLLVSIASTMPPGDALVSPKCPHSINRDVEALWAEWLQANPSERNIAWDKRWKRARNDWSRLTGNIVEWPDV
jgi:hypothetical protein